jgi:hypothetical protein
MITSYIQNTLIVYLRHYHQSILLLFFIIAGILSDFSGKRCTSSSLVPKWTSSIHFFDLIDGLIGPLYMVWI